MAPSSAPCLPPGPPARRIQRLLVLCGAAGLVGGPLLAATVGPDDGDVLLTDSTESPGPPHALLDLDATGADPTALDLGADGTETVGLPFSFSWYGTERDAVDVAADGVLLFEGEVADVACPGAGGDWSGLAVFADDLAAGTVRTATVGRYPWRAFAVEWVAPHAEAGGEGHVQAWLLEGRAEAVISLSDLRFGDAAVDGGASAFVGGQDDASTGVAWSCEGGLVDGSSAWLGPRGERPSSVERTADDLTRVWTGEDDFAYVGQALGGADLDGDGLAELVIGDEDADAAWLLWGEAGPVRSGVLSDTDGRIQGSAGGSLGAAVATGDLDGDGIDDLAIGAPDATVSGTSRVGRVVVLAGGTLGGTIDADDADLLLRGADGRRARAGAALAAGDFDGDGYVDLAVGGPDDLWTETEAGTVWLHAGGAAALAGETVDLDEGTRLLGLRSQDKAGTRLAAGDLDGDGADDLAISAPGVDEGGANAGRIYLVAGSTLSAATDSDLSLDELADVVVDGDDRNQGTGQGLALGDLDGDGWADLVVGVPYYDTAATDAGGAFVFLDPLSGADRVLDDADRRLTGAGSTAHAGSAVAIGDVDGDGTADLLVGADNASDYAAGGGLVALFTDASLSSGDTDDADHRLLGTVAGGAMGTSLLVTGGRDGADDRAEADHDGDGLAELWTGAPLGDAVLDDGTFADAAGAVYGWELVPDFLDADGDGFVAHEAGGLDCDDADVERFPLAGEVADNAADDDCDGWVDDIVVLRDDADHWAWDLDAELGRAESPTALGFEEAGTGEDVTTLYVAEGLTLTPAAGSLTAQADVYGSLAVDTLAAEFTSGDENQLDLVFAADLDALGLRLLDAPDDLLLTAFDADGTVLEDLPLRAGSDDRPGGRFVGLTFADSIDRVRLSSAGTEGWGLDEVQLAWAEDSDRDGDGWTTAEGDCDDSDAERSPDAEEDLSDGEDDDCDGVIDGGELTTWDDRTAWEGGPGDFTAEVIDFEDLDLGDAPSAEYRTVGVLFAGGTTVVADVDGAAPRDAQAAEIAAEGTITVRFTEDQPAVGLYVLDAADDLALEGWLDGVLVYEATVSATGEGIDGGTFLGLSFDLAVDQLVLAGVDDTDDWGVDDLLLHPLGLDDADGDGLTEAEGDCDDDDPDAYPGADETWYDGVDADCGGDSDYDADGDGWDDASGGGEDCDDGDGDISPEATETWYDGVDSDCDGWSDYDADLDGHDDEAWGGEDCDDGDGDISPEATETWYDGVDSDCDGADDYDADGDGWVPSAWSGSTDLPAGDCDDGSGEVSPDAEESWYDGVDSDCDEESDYDADEDGFDSAVYGGEDCDDGDASTFPDAPEDACYDGVDQDCAGDSDYDCDRDGYDSDAWGGEDCDDDDADISPDAEDSPGDGIDSDCDGAAEFDDDGDGWDGVEDGGEDCDDEDASISPDATETWYDGVDSDCAGDDDFDADGDGYRSDEHGGTDCDDSEPSAYPGGTEYPYDGIDGDCDGVSDYDLDGDGYDVDYYGGEDCDDGDAEVSPDATETWYDGVDADCDGASDYDADGDGWDSDAWGGEDCDDADPEISPSALEIPEDGIDQDCDGVDDVDADGDGWGSTADCDDSDPGISPEADETWYDGVDSDCAGDDDYDADGDGERSEDWGGADCDDADAAVLPGGEETWYDGVDSDCDGADDYDRDGDGYRAAAWGGGDCDDADADRNPGVPTDACGGGDEDCDGEVDEDCGGGDTGTGDDGGVDSGGTDGGVDSGGTDGGADSGADGGSSDSGSSDSGGSDSGSSDGGSSDSGSSDGGSSDGGGGGLVDDEPTGCGGCSSGPAGGAALLPALMLGLLGVRRRR